MSSSSPSDSVARLSTQRASTIDRVDLGQADAADTAILRDLRQSLVNSLMNFWHCKAVIESALNKVGKPKLEEIRANLDRAEKIWDQDMKAANERTLVQRYDRAQSPRTLHRLVQEDATRIYADLSKPEPSTKAAHWKAAIDRHMNNILPKWSPMIVKHEEVPQRSATLN